MLLITVVWNEYLLIFWPKCNILLEVGNAVQIIKHVEILRFKPILKLLGTFVGNLFTLKPFISDFWFRFVTKWGRYLYFKLSIMLEYWLCCLICAESDKWKFVDSRCVIFIIFSVVDNNISLQNHKMWCDQAKWVGTRKY